MPTRPRDSLDRPATRSWQPSRFVRASLLLHGGVALLVVLMPEQWPWAAWAIAVNQALILLAGLLPRCAWLGPNWTRLPAAAAQRGEVSITFDDGPDPDITPAVLALLDRYGATASFFCIGEQAQRYPSLCRDIVARGHSLENHSFGHRLGFALTGYRGFLREVSNAQAALSESSGSPPRFFRAPFGIRNPFLEPVLCRLGLQLASWTRRGFDTRERDPDRVSRRLLANLAAGDILLLHDGHAARAADGRAVILHVLPQVLDALDAAGLRSVSLRSAAA